MVAVGTLPHVKSGLGGDDKLIPVGAEVPLKVHAEIALRFSVGRAVVVGEVKMGDAAVEGRAQNLLLGAEGRDIAEIMPETERNGGQKQSALSAAAVGHGLIAFFTGCIHRF